MSLGLNSFNETKKISLKRTTCVKCPENGSVVLNQKDVYCRNCFLHYVSHKFRSTLGKQKIFRSNDKVLIAVSGGASSSALLDLIEQSLENEQKKLKIDPIILYLFDDGASNKREIEENLKLKPYPSYFIPFSWVFSALPSLDRDAKVDEENEEKFKILLKSVKSETAKRDLLKRLKLLCLIRIAKLLNVRYLIVGDNCTDLSSNILSDVAQGRGGQIKDQVSVVDKRWSDIIIVRPLRELQIKELLLYNYFRGVKYFPSLSASIETNSSIQSETNDFVVSLQDQFPATVCTLFSTASKLTSLNSNKTDGNKCNMCCSPVEDLQGCLKNFCYGCNLTVSEINMYQSVLPEWLLQ